MTHMIRVLEAEGYIEIVPNPEDARSKLAKITPKGGELLMQAYAKSAQDAATMDPPPIDRPDGTMFGTLGPNSRATGCCAR